MAQKVQFPVTFRAAPRWLLRRQALRVPLLALVGVALWRFWQDVVLIHHALGWAAGGLWLRFLWLEIDLWRNPRLMVLDRHEVVLRRLEGFVRWRVPWDDIDRLDLDGARPRIVAVVPLHGTQSYLLPLAALGDQADLARASLEAGMAWRTDRGGGADLAPDAAPEEGGPPPLPPDMLARMQRRNGEGD